MKRVIVDYAKLPNEISNLIGEKFADGIYDETSLIRFKNAKNELVEAIEFHTEDTIYLVKVNTKLSDKIINLDEEEEINVEPIAEIEIDDEDKEEDKDEEYKDEYDDDDDDDDDEDDEDDDDEDDDDEDDDDDDEDDDDEDD